MKMSAGLVLISPFEFITPVRISQRGTFTLNTSHNIFSCQATSRQAGVRNRDKFENARPEPPARLKFTDGDAVHIEGFGTLPGLQSHTNFRSFVLSLITFTPVQASKTYMTPHAVSCRSGFLPHGAANPPQETPDTHRRRHTVLLFSGPAVYVVQ